MLAHDFDAQKHSSPLSVNGRMNAAVLIADAHGVAFAAIDNAARTSGVRIA